MKLKDILLKLKNNKGYLKDLLIIKKSNYFDAKWYLATYKDIKKSNIDPAVHYLKYGWKEMRDPSPLFSTSQYLHANLDVKKANINPLVHFEKYGKKEKRKLFLNSTSNIIRKTDDTTYNTIKNSYIYDSEWFYRYYNKTIDEYGLSNNDNNYSYNPSPIFYTNEYLLLHLDVALLNINPILHYEYNGKYEHRAISIADIQEYVAPSGSISHEHTINNREIYSNNIVTVYAIYSKNCKIEDYQLYLLKELHKISDYIIVVADNLIYENELIKLHNLCNAYIFNRHGEYDFGSYKRGYNYLVDNNILKPNDNLLLINDSNYGPIYPLNNIINDFTNKKCDFYGLTVSTLFKPHLQSFFYIFRNNVYSSNVFKIFINNIKKELSPLRVIYNYEVCFTEYLEQNGFKYASYISNNAIKNNKEYVIPSLHPYELISKHKYPFIKRKAFHSNSYQDIQATINILETDNKVLYDIIKNTEDIYKKKEARIQYNIPSKYNLYSNYDKKLKQLQFKYNNNELINMVFLVNMVDMFTSEQLMILFQNNKYFNISLYVIPDTRLNKKEMIRTYNETYNKLKQKYPYTHHSVLIDETSDTILEWYNIVKGNDIVFYPSLYDISFSLYNPYYAVQENILSVFINTNECVTVTNNKIYGIDNLNNFWKLFIDNSITYTEYKIYGQCEASNAVVVGNAKMDQLDNYMKDARPSNQKTIIIAINNYESDDQKYTSSNFETYAELLLELPIRYPNITFIFRLDAATLTILKRKNKWGENKVDNYINKMKSFPNVIYSTESDYLKIFANSDGIIQDNHSFLVEYFYTFKPCCYVLTSPNDIKTKFNSLGVKCLEQVYVAYNEAQITKFIEDVISNNNDHMKESRIEFARKEIITNYTNVHRNIYHTILSYFNS